MIDYPEQGKPYASAVAKSEKAERSKQFAYMKGKGVSIGMSQDEALASNWGKPVRINRTITAHGTNEQWVYGGGNYLYFENGKLTAIQN